MATEDRGKDELAVQIQYRLIEELAARKRAEEALAREKQRLELLYELSRNLVDSVTPRDVAARALDRLCSLFTAFRGTVVITRPGTNRLRSLAISGFDREAVRRLNTQHPLHIGQGVIGRVAETGRAAIVPDVDRDDRWFHIAGVNDGVRSVLALPLIADNELIGVFGLFGAEPGQFHDDQLPFLRAAVVPVAVALKRARLFEQLRTLAFELTRAEEHERRHLATVLHDVLGQTLSLIKLKLGIFQREHDAAPLAELGALLDRTIRQVRTLTFDLSPPILYEVGFEAAVEWLAEQMQEQHAFLCTVEHARTSISLHDGLRALLFTAVRELLFNVAKHARARHAKVTVNRDEDGIRVSVEDDGMGFDSDTLPQTAGFGLFNLHERMSHIGGRMEIVSTPGHGTRVHLYAPLNTPDDPP